MVRTNASPSRSPHLKFGVEMGTNGGRSATVGVCVMLSVSLGGGGKFGFGFTWISGGVKKRQSSSSSSVWRFGGQVGHVTTRPATGCVGCSTEFTQWPRRSGRQFKHFWFAFLHEQFLQLPLALHRQQTGGILQSSSWKNRSNRQLKFTYHHLEFKTIA